MIDGLGDRMDVKDLVRGCAWHLADIDFGTTAHTSFFGSAVSDGRILTVNVGRERTPRVVFTAVWEALASAGHAR